MLFGFGYLLSLLATVGCNEGLGPTAASDKPKSVLVSDFSMKKDPDSISYFILNEIAFQEDGRIVESTIKEAVQNKIHLLANQPCFLEIYANFAADNWLLFNLEAVRREFIRQGLDPVLVSTHKKIRSFSGHSQKTLAFTAVRTQN